ncbi:hypothetical protein G4B88_029105 [Cannabis sativa]|uniref:Uncharacterized protein n=1 Tax=Cannabis sativa TaxID=3483 RepID=A0A7J6DZR4_CANSA|nr:hypothetical protein G4B88_029105 [Cannabis sativa]
MGPFLCVEPPKTTPLATVTGPEAVSLVGLAVDHRILPLPASIATQPPPVVFVVDGFRVKFFISELAMLVYTLFSSVAAPQYPPPAAPPVTNKFIENI